MVSRHAPIPRKGSGNQQQQQNINSTEKHNSINIYNKSMRFMLLHFRNNSRNAWLDLAKCHSTSFSQQNLLLFFVFMSTIVEKDFSQRYVVTNGISISRAISYATSYDAVRIGLSMGTKPKTGRVAFSSYLALFILNSASIVLMYFPSSCIFRNCSFSFAGANLELLNLALQIEH